MDFQSKYIFKFLLIYMIFGSETPACPMSDTQHEPQERENTPPPTPLCMAPPPTFLCSITSAWLRLGVQCLPDPGRSRRQRRGSPGSLHFQGRFTDSSLTMRYLLSQFLPHFHQCHPLPGAYHQLSPPAPPPPRPAFPFLPGQNHLTSSTMAVRPGLHPWVAFFAVMVYHYK